MFFKGYKNAKFKKATNVVLAATLVFALSGSVLISPQKQVDAFVGPLCLDINCGRIGCTPFDPFVATELLMELWQDGDGVPGDGFFDELLEGDYENHLNSEENWIVNDFFDRFLFEGLAELTEYLSANAMFQMQMIGAIFDAKNQLETQRLFFKLQAEAHKDYHPSEGMCAFGTGIKSLAASESLGKLNMLALSRRSIARQLGAKGSLSAGDAGADKKGRWDQFVTTYCNPRDNGWVGRITGLEQACDRDGVEGGSTLSGAEEPSRMNRDIDYTRLIDSPRTLNISFSDDTLTNPDPLPALPPTLPASLPAQENRHDEEDVLALAANLYGHENLTRRISFNQLGSSIPRERYYELRTIVAKRAVAENSFNAIVGMKSAGTAGMLGSAGPETGAYLAAIIRDLMPAATTSAEIQAQEQEIMALIGENPSQYAQLEILSKLIYENPKFFADLYDKPANVSRKSVAMKAIELMVDRALFESELRQEMLMSVMLASKLTERQKSVNASLIKEEGK